MSGQRITGKTQIKYDSNSRGSSILNSLVNITAAAGTYQQIGLSITLPEAGTYLLLADVRGDMQGNAGTLWFIVAKLRNSTDGADIANTERLVVLTGTTGLDLQTTAPISAIVTVAGSKVIDLYAMRNGFGGPTFTISGIYGDANGYTSLSYIRIG